MEGNPFKMFSVPVLYFEKSARFRESDKQGGRQYGTPRLKIFMYTDF